MKKTIIYTFLIFLVVVNLVLLFLTFSKGPRNFSPPKEKFIAKELKFSAQQKKHFFSLDKTHRFQMRDFDHKLHELRNKLYTSFNNYFKLNKLFFIAQLSNFTKKSKQLLLFKYF